MTIDYREPRVSILIPCFNCAAWVHRSIESAIAQTWPNKEVIVLDDGSTDTSLDVIRQFAGQVHVTTQTNGGQNVSRNRLTELSNGEWLVYLDADDELAPDSVEQKLAHVKNEDAIYGTIEVASFAGNDKTRQTVYPAVEFDDPIVAAFEWGFPNTSAFLFRKAAIIEAGGWNVDIHNCTDYDMYFRLLLHGKEFHSAPSARSMYRQWSVGQAVYQDPLRKSRTRLQVMWWAATELRNRGWLTAARRRAFEQAAFGVIRTISQFDLSEAGQHHSQLSRWSADFYPGFSTLSYQLAYRIMGFKLAERFAHATRKLIPTRKQLTGIDPQSGFPYV